MIPLEAIKELQRLNDNLEKLHDDTAKIDGLGKDIRGLTSLLKSMEGKFKAFPALARQIHILNQIMLQSKKAAGTAGMLQMLFGGLFKAAKPGGR